MEQKGKNNKNKNKNTGAYTRTRQSEERKWKSGKNHMRALNCILKCEFSNCFNAYGKDIGIGKTQDAQYHIAYVRISLSSYLPIAILLCLLLTRFVIRLRFLLIFHSERSMLALVLNAVLFRVLNLSRSA